MNARFVTLVLLLFVWLEGDSVWAQYLPKLYQREFGIRIA